jgi:hypothetical protein
MVQRAERNRGQWLNVNGAASSLNDIADWLLILHADDLAKPHWLSMMAERITACAPDVATICSSWDNLQPDGTVNPGEDNPLRSTEVIEGNTLSVGSTLLRGCWWHISGCAIRMDAFRAIGAFDTEMPQLGDLEWLLRCLAAGWSVEYIPRTLILYRQHAASVSSRSFQIDQDVREKLLLMRRYSEYLTTCAWMGNHAKTATFQVRRIARACCGLKCGRALLACKTLLSILGNCLFGRSGIRRGQQPVAVALRS